MVSIASERMLSARVMIAAGRKSEGSRPPEMGLGE